MPSSVKKLLSLKYTAIAILLIISIGVYLNTLSNEFVYDDEAQVLRNPWIKDVKHIPEIFLTNVWAFMDKESPSNYYRPLMHIVYMIDYYIFGLKPWGFHLTNIIFHAGVTLLVFLIASILINQSLNLNSKFIPNKSGQNSKSKIQNPAFIAALLFAAHPIHTEAVTWVGGIPELSFTLFYLLSFYLYINSNKRYTPLNPLLRGENKNKRWGKGFILSLLFFFLAALCKETALTLPLLLFVYDYSLNKNSVYGSRLTVHSIIKRYLLYLIVSIIYFILRTYALGGFAPLPKKHAHLSNYEYFINIFPLFIQYLEKLLLPINMNAFYVFHPISSIFEWKGIIALILTLGFVFLLYFFRRHKVVFLCLLWIVIPLLPVLYIPALGENTFTDRYLYLPSVGFVVLVALAIERISQFNVLRQMVNYVIISILVILTGLYSTGTIKRNHIWKNSYTLWTDTVEKSPDSYIPHNHMGNAYYKKGEINKAFKHYQISLKLMPDSPEGHNNLGNVYSDVGRFDEAIKELMIALRLRPDYPEAHNNLGIVYAKQGRFDEAIKEYLITLKLKPDYPEVHLNLGNVYSALGKFDEAIKEYMIAIRLKPDHPDAHYNLALTYSKQERFDEAIKEYMIAIKLKPNYPEAHNDLGNVYSMLGKFDEAIKEYMIAIRLKPGYAKTHYNLGNAYSAQGRFDEAIKEYISALELNPEDAEVHNNLGIAYSALGRFDEAIKEFLIVLRVMPEDVKAHYNLGNAHFEYSRFDEAIKEYMIAIRLKPDYIGAHYNLGLIYLETGLKHKAEEEFKTVLKLRPDFTPAREALESINRER